MEPVVNKRVEDSRGSKSVRFASGRPRRRGDYRGTACTSTARMPAGSADANPSAVLADRWLIGRESRAGQGDPGVGSGQRLQLGGRPRAEAVAAFDERVEEQSERPVARKAVAAAPTARSAQEPDKVAGCGACSRKREMAGRRISVWNQGGSSASLVPSASRLSRARVQTRSVSVGVCRRGDQAALPDDYLKYSDERAAATSSSAPPIPVLPTASARKRGCGRRRTRSPASGPGQSTLAADRFRRQRHTATGDGGVGQAQGRCPPRRGARQARGRRIRLACHPLRESRCTWAIFTSSSRAIRRTENWLRTSAVAFTHGRSGSMPGTRQCGRSERRPRASDPRRSHLHREDLRHRHAARGGGWSLFGGAPRLDSA
ncbi:hypothetical protein SAMN05421854_108215 [Amycolatopsis rubida]|uniref:Uncharacterized protein n=1 Tax=Amycolatopsis rubida TaxID=112413 RepID=A0A1I5V4S4_9PSEU|nr:hypothetical protein SAMN05421854_108215 [Amycolatopsis rubida]